ncbi:RNaseH domain-containing protein [Thermoactinospora rubra]|uniref:RNaseH domain-containing protein n=1 Tax=Thermoactinospora rubra TaxID=1088767 RepID=UPI001301A28D|nr:RNaseH domain-containing protein [Thermoactinospora rubra]
MQGEERAGGRAAHGWGEVFTLPAGRADEQGNDWHAFTGTEFVVVRPGLINEDQAVAVTARLCAQPLSWDAQTRWPLPLHLANIADEDHPNYRSGNFDEDLS